KVPVRDKDSEEERTIEDQILDQVNNKELNKEQQKQVQELLLDKRDMFMQGLDELEISGF
ncbi:16500_t:CDS:2, partial [Gigaspora margarita]